MASKVSAAPDQNPLSDDQNYDVDIDKIYQNFIVEIDKIRSHISVQDNPSLQTVTDKTVSSLIIDKNPQESRCHAFYRLLGLPITDGTDLYSPGFDQENNGNQTLNAKKLKIAQNISKDIFNFLDAKERIPREFLSIFSTQGVDAMVLGMSLVDIRTISSSFKNLSGPFDTNLNNQAYTSSITSTLVDKVTNNNLSATQVESQRFHILTPLVVDPRIDLNINPQRNRLCVPFVKDKSKTKLTDNIYLKRPYIEKVCRDRFDITNKVVTYGPYVQDILNNIKNSSFISDQFLIKKTYDPNSITSEQVQFANYYNAIRSVLNKLKEAVAKVAIVSAPLNTLAYYNWTPIPNKSGPEFGSTTRDLLGSQSNDPNNTDKDKNLLNLLYKQQLNNISNKLTTLQPLDLGGFAFDNTELTPDQNSSDSLGDTTQAPIDAAQNDRKNKSDAANDAIKNIEIIMGEFSGLGLIDILAISAAFWTVDKETLINLIDSTAIDRMLLNPNLNASEVLAMKNGTRTLNPIQALTNFQDQVKQIYDIIDKLWVDLNNQNTLNS